MGYTCAIFIINVKAATAAILSAPLLESTETLLLALVSATVATCTSDEKTSLLSNSVEMEKSAATIDLNIEHKQYDLGISEGTTASVTEIQAVIEAEENATTAAATTAAAAAATTAADAAATPAQAVSMTTKSSAQ